MQGAVASDDLKNAVWNQIKAVDPGYSDLTCDLTVDTSLPSPPPEETVYTVVAGDSLWKIAQKFYGHGLQRFAPDGETRLQKVGSLRCAFLASPLVHGC